MGRSFLAGCTTGTGLGGAARVGGGGCGFVAAKAGGFGGAFLGFGLSGTGRRGAGLDGPF